MPFEQLLYILHHQGLATLYLQTQTYSTVTKATENIFSFELITPKCRNRFETSVRDGLLVIL